MGLPSVTSFTGKYADKDMYGIGYRAAFNTIFGRYTNSDRTALDGTGVLWEAASTTLQLRKKAEAVKSSSQKGLETGTEVHRILDEWLTAKKNGEEPFLQADPSHITQAKKIIDWLDMHECEIQDVEVNVYHPELLYAGQVDCIARRGNSLLLLDWKSGRGIYNSYAGQIGGYIMCYEAMTGERIDEGWILRSDVDGNFEAKQVEDLQIAKAFFVNMQATKQTFDALTLED
tara:strand:- start:3768 stop:4460 length:693 start_codon:yes stop_codon:yes gene_type:complete